ncbi:MAG: MFS transporter [Bifidobacterium dentium]
MFVYGAIQDQLGIKRKLVIFVSAIAALVGPFVQFVYAPMLTAGGTTRFIGVLIVSSCCPQVSWPVLPVRGTHQRYSRKSAEYGQSRAGSSATPSWRCAGFLFINPLLNLGRLHLRPRHAGVYVWVLAEQKEELKKKRSERGSDQPVLQE